ncbi:MAG: SH3 domain-containing protein [Thermoflexales bacterium]|nr:SH3 domain-containing protein [Thermoflexales bacterium]
MNKMSFRAAALAALTAASLIAAPRAAFAAAPVGVNLLENPGHEHPGTYFAGRGEINVTWSWVPFWQESPPGVDPRDQNYRTPEFRPPFARDYPYRVWSGGGSDRWFNYFALNKGAGIMQVVKNLTVGSPIRFTSMLELWSSNDNDPAIPPKSSRDGDMLVRLCIDQDGGPRDLTDPNVICSPWTQPYDAWRQVYVDGVALAPEVLVIIQSTAAVSVEHNDAYADDSCFEVLPSAGAKGICLGNGFIETGAGPTGLTKAAPLATWVTGKTVAEFRRADGTTVKIMGTAGSVATAPAAGAAAPRPAASPAAGTLSALVNGLRIRATPSLEGEVLGYLNAGDVLPNAGVSGDWAEVNYNGAKAYVYANLTSAATGAPAPTLPAASVPTAVTGSIEGTAPKARVLLSNPLVRLNVRQGPGLTQTIIGNLANGTVVEVLGKSADGEWFQINYNGGKGWIIVAATESNDAAKAVKVTQ